MLKSIGPAPRALLRCAPLKLAVSLMCHSEVTSCAYISHPHIVTGYRYSHSVPSRAPLRERGRHALLFHFHNAIRAAILLFSTACLRLIFACATTRAVLFLQSAFALRMLGEVGAIRCLGLLRPAFGCCISCSNVRFLSFSEII